MKKLRVILLTVMLCLFGTIIVGCGELSLEDIPWRASVKSETEVISLVEGSIENMLGTSNTSASVPVTYKTTITYNFKKTTSGDFEDEEIRDEIKLSLTSGRIAEPKGYVLTKRYRAGKLIREDEKMYVSRSSDILCYINSAEYKDDSQVSIKDMSTQYADNDFALKLVEEIIKQAQVGEASFVVEKNFENVNYYMLSIKNSDNANNIKKLFSSSYDLKQEPKLLEMNDLVMDNVSSFDYQYGINDDTTKYLSYFAMNYTLSRFIEGYNGEREDYLTVSLVTKLDKKGEEVEEIEEVADAGEYVCANFLNIMNSKEHYCIYRQDVNDDEYAQLTVSGDGYSSIIRLDTFVNNSPTSDSVYIQQLDSLYAVDIDSMTYYVIDKASVNLPILDFVFSKEILNKDEESYYYGEEGRELKLEVSNDKVSLVEYNRNSYKVVEYEMEKKSDLKIDLSSFTLIEQ